MGKTCLPLYSIYTLITILSLYLKDALKTAAINNPAIPGVFLKI